MKTKIILLAGILTLTFCKKKEKAPVACIEGPLTVAEGETATYTWCGTNAKHVNWSTNQGGGASGNEFRPVFSSRGTYQVRVTGVNDEGESSDELTVEYGKKSEVICTIIDGCAVTQSISSADFIKNLAAYLYNSKADWITSVTNGNHSLAIDSVKCEYSSAYQTAIARFTKSYPTNNSAEISVEYRHPTDPSILLTNWESLFTFTGGNVAITNIPFTSDVTSATLHEAPNKILRGKWKLSQTYINSAFVPVADCNKDDYIKLSANGTWTYNIGQDNCSGSSLPSNGTFTKMPPCGNSPLYFTTTSGPFTPSFVEYINGTIKADFNSGANSGYFIFTWQP
jgi:hypothetical protein